MDPTTQTTLRHVRGIVIASARYLKRDTAKRKVSPGRLDEVQRATHC